MENNYCYICLNDISNNNMKKLKCNHEFCNDCIKQWFKKNKSCPYCRLVHKEDVDEIIITSMRISLKEFSAKYGFNIE